jgi:hypothetical protein
MLISAVGGYPPATTSTGAFGKYDFMKAKTCLGIDLSMCFT